jgi:hypothetical protein
VDVKLCSRIARVLQQRTLQMPAHVRRVYGAPALDAITDSLAEVLGRIDERCRDYRLKDVIGLTSSMRRLYEQIARAQGWIMLPLNSIVTAPLGECDAPLAASQVGAWRSVGKY